MRGVLSQGGFVCTPCMAGGILMPGQCWNGRVCYAWSNPIFTDV